MCINTGLAEAELENIEPQKGTETCQPISYKFTSGKIREYRTPEGDGNLAFNSSASASRLENIEPQKGTETHSENAYVLFILLENIEPQ